MSPESNPAFQAAWKAHSSGFPIPPFDSERELFRAGYEAREAEVERLRGALEKLHNLCHRTGILHYNHAALEAARAALQPEPTNA